MGCFINLLCQLVDVHAVFIFRTILDNIQPDIPYQTMHIFARENYRYQPSSVFSCIFDEDCAKWKTGHKNPQHLGVKIL